MRKKAIQVLLLFVCVFIVGCGKEKESTVPRGDFSKLTIPEISDMDRVFAVSEEGALYAKDKQGVVLRYDEAGKIVASMDGLQDADQLCFADKMLYAVNNAKHTVLEMNPETGEVSTLTEIPEEDIVQQMAAASKSLYLLTSYWDADKEISAKRMLEVNIQTKAVKEISIKGLCAVYGASDGTLYYCVCEGSRYQLMRYGETKENETVMDLSEQFGIDYLEAFVYEDPYFVCADSRLMIFSVGEQKKTMVSAQRFPGTPLQCVAGNLVYEELPPSNITVIKSAYLLEDTDAATPSGEPDDVQKNPEEETKQEKRTGTLTISTGFPGHVRAAKMKSICGVETKVVQSHSYSDAFLAELMAGNPDVDIYIFRMTEKNAQALKENGVYVPLNDSKVIQDYRGKCFDYLADGMTAENGEIWALPFASNYCVLWYVPENLEKQSIAPSALLSWDSFLETGRAHMDDSVYGAYVQFPKNVGVGLWMQYDRTYCDFSNGLVNYKTDVFKKYFEKMWSDWIIYSQYPMHPCLNIEKTGSELISEYQRYQPERMLYSLEFLDKEELQFHLGSDRWRAQQEPRLTSEVQGNTVQVQCAIVNPYSENQELAIWYLEQIASHPDVFDKYYTTFLFQDQNEYEGIYDMSLPLIQDLYQIAKDGVLSSVSYPYKDSIILDYQEGRLTLEETLERVQRDVEMWLFE